MKAFCRRLFWLSLSPVCRLSFHPGDCFLCCAGALQFHTISFVSYWNYLLCYGNIFQQVFVYAFILNVLLELFSSSFRFSGLTLRFWSILDWFLWQARGKNLSSFFCMWVGLWVSRFMLVLCLHWVSIWCLLEPFSFSRFLFFNPGTSKEHTQPCSLWFEQALSPSWDSPGLTPRITSILTS